MRLSEYSIVYIVYLANVKIMTDEEFMTSDIQETIIIGYVDQVSKNSPYRVFVKLFLYENAFGFRDHVLSETNSHFMRNVCIKLFIAEHFGLSTKND